MFWGWAKNRRRREILANPFPGEWDAILARGVRHVARLPADQQARLRRLVQVFVAEKNWEGLRDLTVTEEMKVVIAAQACLLVVGWSEDFHFDHVLSIPPGETRRWQATDIVTGTYATLTCIVSTS